MILFRAMLFTLLAFLLCRLLRREKGGALVSLLLVFLAFAAIAGEIGYVGDRAQMWSSLLFIVLLGILERMREGK